MPLKSKIPAGWEQQIFSKALSVLKDGTHFSPKVFGGNNLYLTSKNIRMGKLDLGDVSYIPDDEHQRIYSASPVKYGDVLLTKDGAKTGNVCINTLKEEFSLLSSVAYLRGKNDLLLNEFLLQWLLNPRIQFDIKNSMAGQAITRLTLQKIGKFKILLPPLPEQKAIADLLSTWDKAVEKTERLIQVKERRFRWLLRKLMSPATASRKSNDECLVMNDEMENNSELSTHHLALGKATSKSQENEKWKKEKLGKMGNIYSGLTGKKKGDFGSGKPYLPYLNVYQNFQVKTTQLDYVCIQENENQKTIKKGDAFFTVSSETPREVGISSVLLDDLDECYLNSFCFGWRPSSKELLPAYLQFYFRSTVFRKQMKRLAQGATRFNLSKTELMKAHVLFPSLDEQVQIANILSAARKEVDLLKQIAEKYKTQKRGLMQKMLTGEWRVKAEIIKQYKEK